MLSAFKPNDSVYDGKQYLIKKSMFLEKNKNKKMVKKISLPYISKNKYNFCDSNAKNQSLTPREYKTPLNYYSLSSNSLENSDFVITNYKSQENKRDKSPFYSNPNSSHSPDPNINKDNNLNDFFNSYYNSTNSFNSFNSYYNKKLNNERQKSLPKIHISKLFESSVNDNLFSDNYKDKLKQDLKNENKCNYLYLKYEGEKCENTIKNKKFIRINPKKLIKSLKKIVSRNIEIINELNENINKKIKREMEKEKSSIITININN